jgi:hypothetical protein
MMLVPTVLREVQLSITATNPANLEHDEAVSCSSGLQSLHESQQLQRSHVATQPCQALKQPQSEESRIECCQLQQTRHAEKDWKQLAVGVCTSRPARNDSACTYALADEPRSFLCQSQAKINGTHSRSIAPTPRQLPLTPCNNGITCGTFLGTGPDMTAAMLCSTAVDVPERVEARTAITVCAT